MILARRPARKSWISSRMSCTFLTVGSARLGLGGGGCPPDKRHLPRVRGSRFPGCCTA
jgi:hypothetical protein